MSVLTIAKTLLKYDATDLDTKLSDCVTPSLSLFEKACSQQDLERYYNEPSTGSITSTAKVDDYNTICYSNIASVQYLQENEKITFSSKTYIIKNIDKSAYTFEIAKIWTVSESGSFTTSRKSDLDYAAAYFLLYSLVSQAQEIRNGKVLFSSTNWGEGTINQASIDEKNKLANDYLTRAYEFLNYTQIDTI